MTSGGHSVRLRAQNSRRSATDEMRGSLSSISPRHERLVAASERRSQVARVEIGQQALHLPGVAGDDRHRVQVLAGDVVDHSGERGVVRGVHLLGVPAGERAIARQQPLAPGDGLWPCRQAMEHLRSALVLHHSPEEARPTQDAEHLPRAPAPQRQIEVPAVDRHVQRPRHVDPQGGVLRLSESLLKTRQQPGLAQRRDRLGQPFPEAEVARPAAGPRRLPPGRFGQRGHGTCLQQMQLAVRESPFDVLRSAVEELLDPTCEPGHGERLALVQHRDRRPPVAHRVAVAHDPLLAGRLPAHELLTEAARRRDHSLLAGAGERVRGERHARRVGRDHGLQQDRDAAGGGRSVEVKDAAGRCCGRSSPRS